MPNKSTTNVLPCASVAGLINSGVILDLVNLAEEVQLAAEEASYMAEFSLRHIADNGLTDTKWKQDTNIYFPARERETLRFVCSDVSKRIDALSELASKLASALCELKSERMM